MDWGLVSSIFVRLMGALPLTLEVWAASVVLGARDRRRRDMDARQRLEALGAARARLRLAYFAARRC